MKRVKIVWAVGHTVVLVLIVWAPVAAQDSARVVTRAAPVARHRPRVLGVYDEQSGEPIQGLEVIDVMSGTTAVTTTTGTVSLGFLPDGASLVRLRKLGFVPVTMTVAISPSDTTPLTIVMKRSAQELAAVVTMDSARRYIAPGLQGFEERRRLGQGHFIDEATLRKMDGDVMSHALRRIPGAMFNGGRFVSTRKGGTGPVFSSAATGGTCGVAVYENGIRATITPNFDKVAVDGYAAVEFYAGPETYPPWLSPTNNDCGVLLLWTRDR